MENLLFKRLLQKHFVLVSCKELENFHIFEKRQNKTAMRHSERVKLTSGFECWFHYPGGSTNLKALITLVISQRVDFLNDMSKHTFWKVEQEN